MKILHATAEYFPYIKMGGLSDMLSSLTKEQSKKEETFVSLPLLAGFKTTPLFTGKIFPCIRKEVPHPNVVTEILEKSCFREAEWSGVKLYFFDSPLFQNQKNIYGNPDEHFRFAVYSYAAYYLSLALGVDVFHSHDWHTSIAIALHKNSPFGKPTVFTIHNLAYQGDHPAWMTGFLKEEPFHLYPDLYLHEGKVNYMKAGILSCDQLTTVSPGYKNETLTEPNGFGLSYTLRKREEDYTGIINGIDPEEWSPEQDERIFQKYNFKTHKEGKLKNKISLYKEIGRPEIDPSRPLVGIIGRITYQKGYPIFLQSFYERKHLPHYYIFLGAGEEDLQNKLFHISHTEQDRLYFFKGYNEEFARKIEAASDFFLMPSLFEPCGLNQLYSHAYGAVPIVSRVGGLKDTVSESSFEKEYTGIVFEPNDPSSLGYALERAVTLYDNKEKFFQTRERIMNLNWTWSQRVQSYEEVYLKAIGKRK